MKKNMYTKVVGASFPGTWSGLMGLAAVLALAPVTVRADFGDFGGWGGGGGFGEFGEKTYVQSNLVSNLPGVAQLQDTNLVNAWGVSFSSTSPFWISDNGSGLSTLYAVTNDAGGAPHVAKQGLQVTIGGDGFPTGQIFNDTGAFHNDAFIFAGEDGYITGWRGALGTSAEILHYRTNAVYKGITLDTNTGAPELVLANFREGTVDIYDTNLNLTQLADPRTPKGYAPFNVLDIGGFVIVTYAKQDAVKHDDVAGPGHGLIDILDLATGKFYRFATGADAGGFLWEINSPWGIVIEPKGFGDFGDRLLVGNFGSGTIMSFDVFGFFDGLLDDGHQKPIVIDGLWALTFGNGGKAGATNELYFTAGPDSENNGLFGSLVPAPKSTGKY
jgi:uncharacterized protein (TIGR03118 family)